MNAVTPPGISAAFLNAVENVLEQPSGGTETGKYYLNGSGYAAAAKVGTYTCSLSRTAVPVSVVIDTADVAPTNTSGSAASVLSANGFLVNCAASGVATNVSAAGNYTVTW